MEARPGDKAPRAWNCPLINLNCASTNRGEEKGCLPLTLSAGVTDKRKGAAPGRIMVRTHDSQLADRVGGCRPRSERSVALHINSPHSNFPMRNLILLIGPLLVLGALTSGCDDHPASPASVLETDQPALSAAAANAASRQSSDVYTWPPPGDLVEGATATLVRNDNGVSLTWRSTVMEPGAYTIWWVIFNPGACAVPGECGLGDLYVDGDPDLGPNPLVAVMFATGNVVGNSGRANFGAHLNVGEITGSVHPFFPDSPGLLDARNAEIHVVLQDHGEMLPSEMPAQIHEFHGGCPPNDCADLQFAMFK